MDDIQNKQPHTVLIVDDDPMLLSSLAKRLASWSYTVVTAQNSRTGVQAVEAEPPDIVLADLSMPGGDGFELLRKVGRCRPNLPIIIMPDQGELHNAIQALRLGAWDYITKPIEEMSSLQLIIKRVLERARRINENSTCRSHMVELIEQKDAKLRTQQLDLIEKTASLEKANGALKLLLDQREIEKMAIEQTMVANLKRFVFPYLDEMEKLSLENGALAYLDIIRTNIEQLICPLSKGLSGAYRDLTPTEVKIAGLIRQGKSTKDIAAILITSPSTVEKHRNSIRRKLGLLHQKTNLQTYLNSLA